MSTQQQASAADDQPSGLNEEQVAEYLRQHPEFFNAQDVLLNELRIPHACGEAVSLIERQVQTLREQNHSYRRKLFDLVEVGRENDLLNRNLHALTVDVMHAPDLAQLCERLLVRLTDTFNVDFVALRLRGLPIPGQHTPEWVQPLLDSELAGIGLESERYTAKPWCGTPKSGQNTYLFGADGDKIGSMATIPLGLEGTEQGLLALGSSEEHHFHPAMETTFLRHMGQVLGCVFARQQNVGT